MARKLYEPKTPAEGVERCVVKGALTDGEISQNMGRYWSMTPDKNRPSMADDVRGAVRQLSYDRSRPTLVGRTWDGVKNLGDKVLTLGSAAAGGVAGIEYKTAESFAGTALAGQLNGVKDWYLFASDKLELTLSMSDMVDGLYSVAQSAPEIALYGFGGALVGVAAFKCGKWAVKGLARRGARKKLARKISDKYFVPGPATSKV